MRLISTGRSGWRFIGRVLFVSILLLSILLATVWFLVRSEGGRHFIEKSLSEKLGVALEVDRARIGLPYTLVVENVRSAGIAAAGEPGVAAEEMRVGGTPLLWRISIRKGMLRLREGTAGVWEPPSFARIGDLRMSEIAAISELSKTLRDRVELDLSGCNIAWLADDGTETAAVRDLDFSMCKRRARDRDFYYYALSVYRADGTPFDGMRDMRWEWLATAENEYIEISTSSRDGTLKQRGAAAGGRPVGPGDE